MKIHIEINEGELKRLVLRALSEKLGDVPLEAGNVKIMVKSTQNYRSEWEEAKFMATYDASAA